MCKKLVCLIIFSLFVVVMPVKADSLSGLADITVVDGGIVSILYADTEYVVAEGDLVLGTTTRWYIDPGTGDETLWAEGDPAPGATVSGTSTPKEGDVGSNADNFNFAIEGDSDNISSIDGIDFQETIFPVLSDTFFLFERGGNDKGIWQAILEDGSLGEAVEFNKAPYADTGVANGNQNAFGVVFTTDVPARGVRLTASGHDTLSISIPAPEPILVDPNSDLAAVAEAVQPFGSIEFAEGTYLITSQIKIKDGVTYKGAGPGLTIIDGNDTTRAFVAWGDRGATDGQVDANGVSLPNLTGPTGWVIEGMTIQNCASDAENRQDILSAARNLLDNYTGTPYTLATAQEQAGAIADNPEAFEALSGGADDDLTDAELQAYLDNNLPGSEGHYVVNDDKDDDGAVVILKNGAAGTIRNCEFSNNVAVNDAGAIAVEGPGGGVTIQNCVFSNNSAEDDSGAIAVDSSGLAVTIENCAFNSCSALADDGGAVYLSGDASTYIITDTNFTDCYAVNDGGALKGDGADSSYVFSNCTFSNSSADDDGGAIALSASGQTVSIEDCAFIACSNNAGDDAGAIYMSSSDSTYTITGSTFTDCISDDDAGALYCSGGADYVLSDCTFDRNSCGDEGGAIKIGPDNATCTLTNLTFTDCYAGDDAGAVFMDGDGSSYEVTDCSFIGNTCNDDWAAFLYKPYRSELIMTNCSFVSNGLDADGVVVGDDSVLGVDRDDAGAVTISNCLIAYNACNADWILEVKDLATISNCTFIGNESPKQTIGLRANPWDSTGDENDDVVAGNSTISNCLFINNTTASAVIGDSKNADFTATVTNCLFFGNLDQDGAASANTNDEYPEVGTIDVSAVTDAAQIVVDPAGDYHPAAGSPAIDASDPATATEADIEGTPAVGVRDVGAYESAN